MKKLKKKTAILLALALLLAEASPAAALRVGSPRETTTSGGLEERIAPAASSDSTAGLEEIRREIHEMSVKLMEILKSFGPWRLPAVSPFSISEWNPEAENFLHLDFEEAEKRVLSDSALGFSVFREDGFIYLTLNRLDDPEMETGMEGMHELLTGELDKLSQAQEGTKLRFQSPEPLALNKVFPLLSEQEPWVVLIRKVSGKGAKPRMGFIRAFGLDTEEKFIDTLKSMLKGGNPTDYVYNVTVYSGMREYKLEVGGDELTIQVPVGELVAVVEATPPTAGVEEGWISIKSARQDVWHYVIKAREEGRDQVEVEVVRQENEENPPPFQSPEAAAFRYKPRIYSTDISIDQLNDLFDEIELKTLIQSLDLDTLSEPMSSDAVLTRKMQAQVAYADGKITITLRRKPFAGLEEVAWVRQIRALLAVYRLEVDNLYQMEFVGLKLDDDMFDQLDQAKKLTHRVELVLQSGDAVQVEEALAEAQHSLGRLGFSARPIEVLSSYFRVARHIARDAVGSVKFLDLRAAAEAVERAVEQAQRDGQVQLRVDFVKELLGFDAESIQKTYELTGPQEIQALFAEDIPLHAKSAMVTSNVEDAAHVLLIPGELPPQVSTRVRVNVAYAEGVLSLTFVDFKQYVPLEEITPKSMVDNHARIHRILHPLDPERRPDESRGRQLEQIRANSRRVILRFARAKLGSENRRVEQALEDFERALDDQTALPDNQEREEMVGQKRLELIRLLESAAGPTTKPSAGGLEEGMEKLRKLNPILESILQESVAEKRDLSSVLESRRKEIEAIGVSYDLLRSILFAESPIQEVVDDLRQIVSKPLSERVLRGRAEMWRLGYVNIVIAALLEASRRGTPSSLAGGFWLHFVLERIQSRWEDLMIEQRESLDTIKNMKFFQKHIEEIGTDLLQLVNTPPAAGVEEADWVERVIKTRDIAGVMLKELKESGGTVEALIGTHEYEITPLGVDPDGLRRLLYGESLKEDEDDETATQAKWFLKIDEGEGEEGFSADEDIDGAAEYGADVGALSEADLAELVEWMARYRLAVMEAALDEIQALAQIHRQEAVSVEAVIDTLVIKDVRRLFLDEILPPGIPAVFFGFTIRGVVQRTAVLLDVPQVNLKETSAAAATDFFKTIWGSVAMRLFETGSLQQALDDEMSELAPDFAKKVRRDILYLSF